MDLLLSEINSYNYQKVFVLGYYNITNKHNDIFTYLNYKMKKITNEYNYEYIELNNILGNNPNFYQKNNNFNLNNRGYNEINKIIVEKLKKY
jgi:lysophospholipase L1-like esterase